ncbi:TIGR02186 family protein [Paracoccus sp. DMF-8]|uniref:TIGR02186 family protein n=1 Tax=Paracoccus sp. DMF-8 TaxID=3019445 RepID=UPI0023E7BDF6|nr:TIGR02186 family protein [Paracoccus sp. DMF-8]MDF3604955.1 TIGR02186 family protein [Paracoccus sp. DMF-8]
MPRLIPRLAPAMPPALAFAATLGLALTLPMLGRSQSQNLPPAPEPVSEHIVAGLSHDDVNITTNFDGSDIIIYGAISRETPAPAGPLDVIVAVQGPSKAVTIRRKDRRFGVWVNTDSVRIGSAPDFYVVATTRPSDQILTAEQDAQYRVSIPQAVRSFAGELTVADTVPFTEAFVRLRQEAGLYRLDDGAVTLAEQTLFRADVQMPANLIEGMYSSRILLVRDGRVIDTHRAPIEVRKVGLERWLYRMALDRPPLYGLMSLLIAIAAGWTASVAFRTLQRK